MARTKKDMKRDLLNEIEEAKELITHYQENGNADRIQFLKGKIAQCEHVLEHYLKYIDHKAEPPKSLQTKMKNTYKSWVRSEFAIQRKLDKIEVLKINELITKFQTQYNLTDEEDILRSWEIVLASMKTMPPNIREYVKISQINKNLFNIITILKWRQNARQNRKRPTASDISDLAAQHVDQQDRESAE